LDVAVSHTFEINHRRCDVAVTHPLLKGSNVDSILEMTRCVGMAAIYHEQ